MHLHVEPRGKLRGDPLCSYFLKPRGGSGEKTEVLAVICVGIYERKCV